MNVLSLFDGISCAQVALNRAKIQYNNYYSSEINKHAISITQRNYKNTIQLGDVKKIHKGILPKIDILIGGSPCQGFSQSGKRLGFEDERSSLFFEYYRLLKELEPKYFILENVKMKKETEKTISGMLKVDPILINSNLVSAQNRPRLYWTNIKNIQRPKNKNIYLSDILQCNTDKKYNLDINKLDKKFIETYKDKKNMTFTERRTKEAKELRKLYRLKYGKDYTPRRAKELTHRKDNKSNCLTATFSKKEHIVIDNNCVFRKLTPIEFERLQTIPDNYTAFVSDYQRYKMIGNSFTVDVIAHILKNIGECNE